MARRTRAAADRELRERAIKKLILSVLLSAASMATAVAREMPGEKGCSPLGTWFTTSNSTTQWMATFEGTASGGTYAVETPLWENVTLYGLFPTAIRVTTVRGVWERRSGTTFAATEIVWAVDATGNVVYQWKISGTTTLTDGCNKMSIELVGQLFAPGADPFTDEPISKEGADAFALPPMAAYRVNVEPPAEVPPTP